MALIHTNDNGFEKSVANGLTLVDFWADWCGPCKMFGPIFEKSAESNPDVNFVKFAVDAENRATPSKFGIRGIPSVLAFKNGELVESRTGLMDEETLNAWIAELKGS